MTFVLPSILMAYWNIRIGFVMKSSMTQLTEDGNQPQLQALLKKRKVKFWKQINLFVNTRLMDNKFLSFIYFFFCWGGAAFSKSDVGHVGDFLPVLAALSDVHDLPDIYFGNKFGCKKVMY